MNYILRAIFILSFVVLLLGSLITWQQWSPFTPRSADHTNFLRTVDDLAQATGFLFFAAALLEAWIGSLDKRISGLALGAFILQRFAQLDSTEKNILLGIAVVGAVLMYLLLRRPVTSPELLSTTSRSIQPTDRTPDSSRLRNTVDTPPTDTPAPQPPFKWAKAKRLLSFIAFGDLDAKQARKAQAK